MEKTQMLDKHELNENELGNELEGIIMNEPQKNKYETIRYHKMNVFPYYLIGRVVSKFEIDGIPKFLNGVGILIGPSVVLTVGHNLCQITPQNKSIIYTKKVLFFLGSNGDYNLFKPVKSSKTYIAEEYITSLKSDNKDEQLFNDWGLIYLSTPIGTSLTKLLELKDNSRLTVSNHLYSYFTINTHQDILQLVEVGKSEKLSIVGYTEYKENYKNNSSYKFLNNFRRKTVAKDKDSHLSFKTNQETLSNHKDSIISGIMKEGNLLNSDNSNINININFSKEATEGLIISSRHYQPNIYSDKGKPSLNGLDYIIFGNEDSNKDFDVTDAEKLIMSESKGHLIKPCKENNEDSRMLKYQISTYKGQSGSPIFIRVKSKTAADGYSYYFVGLHSRRGPTVIETLYESDKMNMLTENLLTLELPVNNYNPNTALVSKEALNEETSLKKNLSNTGNDLLQQNGVCNYNMALGILGKTKLEIVDLVKKEYSLEEDLGNTSLFKSEFVNTKLIVSGIPKFSGLFKSNVPLSVLFSFGANILNVPRHFLVLQYCLKEDDSYSYYSPNDDTKKLIQVMTINDIVDSITFDLTINIEKYGKHLGEIVYKNYLDVSGVEDEVQLKKEAKKHMQNLFRAIFKEIIIFEPYPLLFGRLFKKVRQTILKQLGVVDEE